MKQQTKRRLKELQRGRQDLRKMIHIGLGLFGFLYAFLDWELILLVWTLATACAWLLPICLEQVEILLTKAERKVGYSLGMISYGLVMIASVIIFRNDMLGALMVLAVLSFGDGFSGLMGANYRGTPLPWNERKSWTGSMAFIIFGSIGALALIFFFGVFALRQSFDLTLGALPIFRVLIVMFIGAIVESIPWRIPDNIPIAMAAIIAIIATSGLYN